MSEWTPGRWWRVMRGGKLWCETSDEDEAREAMAPGDVLQRIYERHDTEWRTTSSPPNPSTNEGEQHE